MSYYKVKSVDLRNWEEIYVTTASNNVRPIYYTREKYTGSIEDLFQDLLSGNLKINNGNKQKIHEAYLQATIYLRSKEVDTYEIYKKGYNGDRYYEQSFKVFKQVLENKRNTDKYYIEIDGTNFHGWTKYGYKYSYFTKCEKPFIDLLKAQIMYGDSVTYSKVKQKGEK